MAGVMVVPKKRAKRDDVVGGEVERFAWWRRWRWGWGCVLGYRDVGGGCDGGEGGVRGREGEGSEGVVDE